MPLKTEGIEEPQLNLTPMLDVVLQLIIFFMVGTRFAELERQFDILLPTAADAQPLTDLPDDIVLNVQADGQVVVDQQIRSVEEIEALLRTARENYPAQVVTIRGDARTYYQYVTDMLAACHRAGIKNISLPTRVGDQPPIERLE